MQQLQALLPEDGRRWGVVGAASLFTAYAAFKWLPKMVVRHRMKLLTSINDGVDSGEGIQVPNSEINCNGFRALYKSRAARGRSEGAALSDLFWYFLSPGPEIHPEQVEDGPKWDQINLVTQRILMIERSSLEAMLTKYTERHLAKVSGLEVIRLRDWYMELFAAFLHEMIFGDEATEEVLAMIVRHATNIIETLKWCELRDMDARMKVVNYCQERVRQGALPASVLEGADLSEIEVALVLSNAFFNTGVVQSSEAMTHATLAFAQHPEEKRKLAAPDAKPEYVQGYVNECFRLWPLFGIAHRILTGDVTLPPDSGKAAGTVVKRGTVVCFNYPEYHSHGYDEPKLWPERWATLKPAKANFCPFGMLSNRPCPAQHLVTRYMVHLLPLYAKRLDFDSPVAHSRSLPGAGLCVISKVEERDSYGRLSRGMLKLALGTMEEVKTVYRSVLQFYCSRIIVGEAMTLRLCDRFFLGGEKLLKVDQQFDDIGKPSVRARAGSDALAGSFCEA